MPRFRDPKDPVVRHIESGKPTLVMGLGRSGTSAANLLAELGCHVEVSEREHENDFVPGGGVLHPDVHVHWGGHPPELIERFDLVIVSPGIPADSEAVCLVKNGGAEVVGEMELAFRLTKEPWVAITGSNGKSTTTTLVGMMAEKGKISAVVGGNLGTPVTEFVMVKKRPSWIVAEVSSFQLETVQTFHPSVGALLNISPDHLDRYSSEKDYISAKAAIFDRMTAEDWAIVNEDDTLVRQIASGIGATGFSFSRKPKSGDGVFLDEGWLVIVENGRKVRVVESSRVALKGNHNMENALAAVAVARKMGVDPEVMGDVLKSFKGLEHRMEMVGFIRGIPVYNDSKGTNVGATLRSLEGLGRDVVLIMGGKDKGASYGPLYAPINEKVSLLILIGEAAGRMNVELGRATETESVGSIDEAVKTALARARPGAEILFSPACSSFDMFSNYEERGRVFKELVRRYMNMGE